MSAMCAFVWLVDGAHCTTVCAEPEWLECGSLEEWIYNKAWCGRRKQRPANKCKPARDRGEWVEKRQSDTDSSDKIQLARMLVYECDRMHWCGSRVIDNASCVFVCLLWVLVQPREFWFLLCYLFSYSIECCGCWCWLLWHSHTIDVR